MLCKKKFIARKRMLVFLVGLFEIDTDVMYDENVR